MKTVLLTALVTLSMCACFHREPPVEYYPVSTREFCNSPHEYVEVEGYLGTPPLGLIYGESIRLSLYETKEDSAGIDVHIVMGTARNNVSVFGDIIEDADKWTITTDDSRVLSYKSKVILRGYHSKYPEGSCSMHVEEIRSGE